MVLCMKAIGEMIFNTEKVKKVGQMDLYMKVTIWLVKNTVLGFIVGMMVASILVIGVKIKLKVLELIAG